MLAMWLADACLCLTCDWLMPACRAAIRAPGLQNVIKRTYFFVHVLDKAMQVIMLILDGVLQGCGFLFSMAIQPFLHRMYTEVDRQGRGITRACADDVGAVLFHIAAIKAYYTIFELRPCTTLTYKFGLRCVLRSAHFVFPSPARFPGEF